MRFFVFKIIWISPPPLGHIVKLALVLALKAGANALIAQCRQHRGTGRSRFDQAHLRQAAPAARVWKALVSSSLFFRLFPFP